MKNVSVLKPYTNMERRIKREEKKRKKMSEGAQTVKPAHPPVALFFYPNPSKLNLVVIIINLTKLTN